MDKKFNVNGREVEWYHLTDNEIAELLQRCKRDIGQNANAKIVFYDMALKIIVLLIAK